MTHTILVALSLLAMVAYSSAAPSCHPPRYGDASRCSSGDKQTSQVKDLDGLLHDALANEGTKDFVTNITLGMYRYIHPCDDTNTLILRLFYGVSGGGAGQPIGKRDSDEHSSHNSGNHNPTSRDHYLNENDLLNRQLQTLVSHTGGDTGCLSFLVDKYRDPAATNFKAKYPHFHASVTTAAPPVTTAAPPVTTAAPPVTTAAPVTTQAPATTQSTDQCTECSGLQCLLAVHTVSCQAGQDFCFINVEDQGGHRTISRGCTDEATCRAISNDQKCSSIETASISTALTCKFCCQGDNCNVPPSLMPASGAFP